MASISLPGISFGQPTSLHHDQGATEARRERRHRGVVPPLAARFPGGTQLPGHSA